MTRNRAWDRSREITRDRGASTGRASAGNVRLDVLLKLTRIWPLPHRTCPRQTVSFMLPSPTFFRQAVLLGHPLTFYFTR